MLQPREYATPVNKAPVIRALAALFLVISVLAAITRIITRMLILGTLKVDDSLALASMVIKDEDASDAVNAGCGHPPVHHRHLRGRKRAGQICRRARRRPDLGRTQGEKRVLTMSLGERGSELISQIGSICVRRPVHRQSALGQDFDHEDHLEYGPSRAPARYPNYRGPHRPLGRLVYWPSPLPVQLAHPMGHHGRQVPRSRGHVVLYRRVQHRDRPGHHEHLDRHVHESAGLGVEASVGHGGVWMPRAGRAGGRLPPHLLQRSRPLDQRHVRPVAVGGHHVGGTVHHSRHHMLPLPQTVDGQPGVRADDRGRPAADADQDGQQPE